MTLIEQLARFFRDRPHHWVDGERLEKVAGKYAWRTRVSDLRRPPFGMTIENRQRRLTLHSGRTFKVSEYRYVPAAESSVAAPSSTGASLC